MELLSEKGIRFFVVALEIGADLLLSLSRDDGREVVDWTVGV